MDNGGDDQVNDNGSPRDIVRIGLCEETLVSDLLTVPNHRGSAYEFRQEVQAIYRPISSLPYHRSGSFATNYIYPRVN